MDTLRLILFLVGIVIVLAVYGYTRKSSGLPLFNFRSDKTESDDLIPEPPPLTDEDIADAIRNKRYASDIPNHQDITQLSDALSAGVKKDVDTGEVGSISSLTDEEQGEPLLVVLSIMAKRGEFLHGMDILDAVKAAGFAHGEMNIFHYHDASNSDQPPICSLANSIEPGYFDMDNMNEVETPGLTLFMQLPGPVDERQAFEQTLKRGRELAEKLNADLCDETRSVLTMQNIEHLKEKIEAHRFKTRMAQIKKHRH